MKRANWWGLALVVSVAGCQAPAPLSPLLAPTRTTSNVSAGKGSIAITIHWPYATQTLPESTLRLHLTLTGPSPRDVYVIRTSAPVSTASLQVDAGTGYSLAVDAYADADTNAHLIASGHGAPFDVAANKVSSVHVPMSPVFVPSVTGFYPDNGGPGSYVQVYGTNYQTARGVSFRIKFNGVLASVYGRIDEGTASVLVPSGATTGPILPIVDGVTGVASTASFTMLSSIGIDPFSPIASGSTASLTASATSSAGTAFAHPAVQWYLATDSFGVIDPATGVFRSNGRTGSVALSVFSGQLQATRSLTVVP